MGDHLLTKVHLNDCLKCSAPEAFTGKTRQVKGKKDNLTGNVT